jgi:hypothetical protein
MPCRGTTSGPELLAQNPALANPGFIDKNWDFNPGFGGPIKKDKVWFYASGRYQGAYLFAPGMFYNANANNPARWDYVADTSRPASIEKTWLDGQMRLSWQASPKNKIGATYTQQSFCACHDAITATVAPEAANDRPVPHAARHPGGLDVSGHEQGAHRSQWHPSRRALGQHALADEGPRPRPADDRRGRAGRGHPRPAI